MSASEGAVPGFTTNMLERVCQRGHRGVPLKFNNETAWRAFLASKQATP